jgi:hypothetical protein
MNYGSERPYGRHGRGWSRRWDRLEYRGDLQPREARDAIQPLLHHLETYDRWRLALTQEGGSLADLQRITSHLQTPVQIRGGFADGSAKLTEQGMLQRLLRDVHDGLRLDVRQRPSGMPVYYVCRVQSDYWSDTRLIVEDYYLSAGYPLADERFARLMQSGHEVFFLRLSPFRQAVARCLQAPEPAERQVDAALFEAAQTVLQSAWHEDQRLAIKVARHFHLPRLVEAIELLYLTLNADLSEVRDATNPAIFRFFEQVYPQPGISRLLRLLSAADGTAVAALPQRAKHLYGKLLSVFSRFLGTEIPWGGEALRMPLWRAVYGNYGRVGLVGEALVGHPAVCEARSALEHSAAEIAEEVLDLGSARSLARSPASPSSSVAQR